MGADDKEGPQDAVIRFLSGADAFGLETGRVERTETHISLIFMAADRVFKLKRAVLYPYLDFSTRDKRRAACEAEVRINRRTAPDLYLGVRAVVRRGDGQVAWGDEGDGEVLDWVVEMVRFDETTLFDRLAGEGKLDRRLMEELGDVIAAFHLSADVISREEGHASFVRTIEGNAETFEDFGADVFDMDDVRSLIRLQSDSLTSVSALLDARARNGSVRHCHGDLHLRNVFLDEGKRPFLFDAIEFNTLFAEIDVLYDLSFLLMDLDHRGHRRLASILMNRYLDVTGDGEGLALLGLFLSLRAAIRAHVDATAAHKVSDAAAGEAMRTEARSYFMLARSYLEPSSPRLIATGGLSGSGKSRMARELAPLLAPAPGARVVRSDSTRKRLAGVALTERLDQSGYSEAMTEKTYAAVMAETAAALEAGHSVIADAVFAREDERRAIEAVAARLGVPFTGLWLEADPAIMAARAESRTGNVSDADANVVQKQLDYDLGTITWKRVDSSGSRADSLRLGRLAAGL